MQQPKVYIAGGGGMLGEAFYRQFSNDFDICVTDKIETASWVSTLDFRNEEAYRKDVVNFHPDYLFHLGAHTDLEYCEKNPDDAYATNTESVKYAVSISNDLNIPLLYISTAGIFDGNQEVYTEDDQPNPQGHYARSKYLGEEWVTNNSECHLICRAGWMMGGGEKDKKFVGKIMAQVRAGKKKLFVVDDKFGTPTYTHDFATTVKELIETKSAGLYNMACSGVTSRLEIAREIINILGRKDIEIIPVNSDHFKQEYFAPRPYSERLVNKRLDEENKNRMRDWKVCLKEYLSNYFREEFG